MGLAFLFRAKAQSADRQEAVAAVLRKILPPPTPREFRRARVQWLGLLVGGAGAVYGGIRLYAPDDELPLVLLFTGAFLWVLSTWQFLQVRRAYRAQTVRLRADPPAARTGSAREWEMVSVGKTRAIRRTVIWSVVMTLVLMLTIVPILLGTVTAWSVGLVVAGSAVTSWAQWRLWQPRR